MSSTIGLISDVHANLAALRAVLAELDSLGVGRIVCLGDTAGYHAEVNECCELVRARAELCLLGNHDAYLAHDQACPRSSSANRCLDYQRQVLSQENRDWLASLAPAGQIGELRMVHGGWNDPLDEYLQPGDAYFAHREGSLFASGHTHVPRVWHGARASYCNPGAVGQPRDGDPRAAFATLDGRTFRIHRVAYDVTETQAAMRRAGFEPYFFEHLARGTRIGGRIDGPTQA